MLKIKAFLHKEILKRHLYYYYFSHLNSTKNFVEKNPGKLPTEKDYQLYVKICYKLKGKLDYVHYMDKFVFYGILEPLRILLYKDSLSMKIVKYIKIFFTLLPKIILVILLIIDCIYNHFNIHLIFYYLPFYFVFSLWTSLSAFLKKTHDSLNNIIYERYYEENVIKYINTTDEEDNYIFKYIEQHCICFIHNIKTDDFDIYTENMEAIFAFPQIFIYNRRFIRVGNTNIFQNLNTGEEALPQNLITRKTDFITNEGVHKTLENLFRSQVIPKVGEPLEEYQGVGITDKEIEQVLLFEEKDKKEQAQKDFQKYKQKKSQVTMHDIQEWLDNKKKVEPSVYKHLKILIEEYENKFK